MILLSCFKCKCVMFYMLLLYKRFISIYYDCLKISFSSEDQIEKTELRKSSHLGSSLSKTFYTEFHLPGGQLSQLYAERHWLTVLAVISSQEDLGFSPCSYSAIPFYQLHKVLQCFPALSCYCPCLHPACVHLVPNAHLASMPVYLHQKEESKNQCNDSLPFLPWRDHPQTDGSTKTKTEVGKYLAALFFPGKHIPF